MKLEVGNIVRARPNLEELEFALLERNRIDPTAYYQVVSALDKELAGVRFRVISLKKVDSPFEGQSKYILSRLFVLILEKSVEDFL